MQHVLGCPFRFLLTLLLCLLPVSLQARVIGGTEMMDMDMEENLCALTFDDGPSIFTPQLLDTLKEHHIHATFFMLGKMVNNYPEIAKRVAAEGHEVASHTYSHKNLKRLSTDSIQAEISRGYDALTAIGIVPTYLRPPYGSYDERTVGIATSYGMDVVLWSMDSLDWKRLPADYGKIPSVRGAVYGPGEIRGVFLFHDIHKRTVDDVPRVIEELRRAGCERFVTLSEYMQGVLDPEPALLMTRRPVQVTPTAAVQTTNYTSQDETKQPEIHVAGAPSVAAASPEEEPPHPKEEKQEEEEASWLTKAFELLF